MATNKLSIKLLIDKKANRVLFAEAGKDFVDFLFSLLSLPVGSIIKLLTKKKMVGCLGNLYQSVENLDDTYILQPTMHKDLILNPKSVSAYPLNVPLLTPNEAPANTSNYYVCSRINNNTNQPSFVFNSNPNPNQNQQHFYVTTNPKNTCPDCGNRMSKLLTVVTSNTEPAVVASPSAGEKGYVKGVVTYMVMDDLTVMPMSTISSITLLNKFNVENLSLLEERTVDFGMKEGLQLLKISLQSESALSAVFLGFLLPK